MSSDPFGGMFGYVPGMEPPAQGVPPPPEKKKRGLIPDLHAGDAAAPVPAAAPPAAPALDADPFGGMFGFVPGMEPVAEPPKPEPADDKRSGFAEIAQQFRAGTTIDLPRTGGQFVKAVAPPGGKVEKWAEGVIQAADERAERETYDGRSRGWEDGKVVDILATGARNLPVSMAVPAAIAVGALGLKWLGAGAATVAALKGLSGLATGLFFGLSTAQDKFDRIKKDRMEAGEDEATAEYNARLGGGLGGLLEGLGEAVAARFGVGGKWVASIGGKLGLKTTQKTAADIVSDFALNRTKTDIVKSFAKDLLHTYPVEMATEFIQEGGGVLIEKAFGVKEGDAWAQALEGAKAALGMTTLMAPFGLRSSSREAGFRNEIADALNNPDAPPEVRGVAVRMVAHEIKEAAGAPAAEGWAGEALRAVDAGQPIPLTPAWTASSLNKSADEMAAFEQREAEQAKAFVGRAQAQVADMRKRVQVETDPEAQAAMMAQIEEIEAELDNVIRAYPGAHNPADALKPGQGVDSVADDANKRIIEEAAGVATQTPSTSGANAGQMPGIGDLPAQQQPGTVPAATAPANPDAMPAQKQAMVGDQGPFDILGVPNNPGKITLWDPATGQSFVEDRANVTMVDPPAPGAAAAPAAVLPVNVMGPDGTRHDVAFPDNAAARMYEAAARFEERKLKPASVDPVLDRMAKELGVTKPVLLQQAAAYKAAVDAAMMAAGPGAAVQAPAFGATSNVQQPTSNIQGGANAQQALQTETPVGGQVPIIGKPADEKFQSLETTQIPGSTTQIPAARSGQRFEAVTPQGDVRVSGEWAVMDAGALITSDDKRYDAALQPRDRDTKSSQEQIAKIAAAPDPTRLNDSPTTDLGAPMVDELGQVISGNGRVMGLRKAFASKRGAAYQNFVKQRAAELGVDVSGMKNPVLVRMVRDTAGVPMPQVAELSNRPQILQRTSAEIAAADAKVLADTNIMDLFDPSESGDLMAASNRPFLTEFVRQTGDESLRKSDGTFDREKMEPRIHRAVMMRIIGQTEKGRDLARQAIENAEVLGIRPALMGVMRAGGKLVGTAKVKPQYDLSAELAEGLELLVQFKKEFTEGKTRTLDGWLAQQDMFKAPASLEGTIILQELARRRSIKGVTEFLNEYAERAAKVDTDTGMMFADIQPSTKLELLRGARDATMPTAEEAAADAGGVAREERAEYGTRPDYKGIATKAHEGQTRKDGITPYITHPERVVARLAGDPDAQAVAWLHDVVEDTSETIESLRGRGVPENILDAVDALTKRPGVDYAEYIQRIKSNPLARKVKIADMMDNLSGAPSPEARARYIKGLKTLQAGAPYNAASGKPQVFRSEDKPVYGSAPAESSRDSVWAALKKKMPWFTNAIDGYLATRHPYLQDELIRVAAIEPQKLDLTPEQESNIKKAKELAKVKLDEDVKTHKTAFDAYQAEFTPEIVEGYVRQVEEVALLFGDGAFALARGVPLKSARRGIEKAVEDSTIEGISVDAAIAKIKDIVRSTILVHNESDLAAVAEAVKESFGVTKDRGKHKDRTGDNHTLGYEDRLIQVPLSNGRFAEVQVMTPVMFVAKEFGAGHKYYEMDREVRAAHTAGFMSRNQQDKFRNKLAKLSKEFYQSLAKKPYVLAFERVAREASSEAISSLDMRASSPVWPKGQPDLRETGVGSTLPSDLESRKTSERSSTSNVSLRSKKIAEGEKDSTSEAAGDSSSAFISGIPSTDNVVQRQLEIKQKLAENARNLPKKQRGYFWEYAAHKARIEAGEPAGKPPRPRLSGGVPMTGSLARRIRAQVDALVEESRRAMPERAGVAREESATYGTRQTETPEFKKWFRDSRVVNEQTGEPLRVFHGTLTDFDTFKRPGRPNVPRRTAGRQLLGDREMYFFTNDAEVASNYGGTSVETRYGRKRDYINVWGPDVKPNVMPVYLSLQNPLRMTAEGQGWRAAIDRIKNAHDSGNYDGVILYDVSDWYSPNADQEFDDEGNRRTSTVYIAFKANQIKSATGNSGAFSRRDRSIMRDGDRPAYGSRQDRPAPPFFSQLRRHIEAKMPKRAPVEAVRNLINPEKGSGVKAEEIEWTGLGDFLAGKSPVAMVTKDDVLAAIQDVRVEETTLAQSAGIENARRAYADSTIEEIQNLVFNLGFLDSGQVEAMSREELLQALVDSRDPYAPDGESKYHQYQLPGGENYRELLLTLPVKTSGNGSSIIFPSEDALESFLVDMDNEGLSDLDYGRRDEANSRVVEFDGVIPAAAMRIVDANNGSVVSGNEADGQTFVANHFSQPNILAHVRFNERTDAEGRRHLFVEEMQSDWHQEGRKKGYVGDADALAARIAERDAFRAEMQAKYGDRWQSRVNEQEEQRYSDLLEASKKSSGVPDAPFKNNAWAKLAMKRMIRWAAENGFDSVAWTTGEQQAERYDLSKQVDYIEVEYDKDQTPGYKVDAYKDGRMMSGLGVYTAEELPNVIGKDLADRVVNDGRVQAGEVRKFKGDDLKVGGAGMKGFYDKILVNIANELGKKFGARAETREIPTSMREYGMTDESGESYTERRPEQHILAHVLPITPAMRDSVVYQGQALFERKPAGGYGSGQMSLFTPEVVAAARRDVDGETWTRLESKQVKVGLEVRDRFSKENLGPITSVDVDRLGMPRPMTRKGTYMWTNLETTGRIINQEGTNEQVATAGTGREAAKGSGPELPGVSRAGDAEGRGPAADGDAQVGQRGGQVRRNPQLEQVGFDFESTTGKGVSGPGVSVETRTLAGQSAPGGAGLDLFAWSRTHAMVPETPRRDAATAGTGTPLVPTRNYDLRGKPSVRLSKSERKRINAQVVNILDRLDAEKRPATDAERDILRQYTGEGGLSSGTREALTQHWTDYETTGAMWETLERAGVPMVRAIEGAGGAGNFVGQRPGLQWTTVDIDPTNHRVLKALYPDAKHYLTSFEYFKDDGFDVAISNVPFLEMRSAAGIMKIRRDIKSLHDFYFAHSLDRVKPNGVIAYITSTGTMDKKDASVRREVIGKADVLAAYRLPEGHFSKNAHTEVTTDIIYLMRRPDGVAPSAAQQAINEAWAEAAETADGVTMSRYYEMFPQNILGEKTLGKDRLHGGKPMYVVKGPADLSRMSISYKPYATATVTGTAKKSGVSSMPKLISAPPARLDDLATWAKKNGFMVRNRARVVTNLSDGKQSVTEMIDDNYSQNVFVSQDGKTVWRASDLVDLKDVEGTAKVYRPITTASADKIAMLDRITKLAEAFQNEGDSAAATSAIELIAEYREKFNEHPKQDKGLKAILEKAEPSMWAEFITLFDDKFAPADVFSQQTRYSDSGKAKVAPDAPLLVRAFASENNKGIVKLGANNHVKASEWAALAGEGYALVDVDDASVIEPFTMQNAILYYSGNIYEKLEKAESLRRRATDPVQRDILDSQIAKLESLKPLPKSLPEMTFRGTEAWIRPILDKARLFRLGQTTDEKSGQRRWTHPNDAVENYLNNRQLVKRAVDKEGNPTETEGQFMARTREAEEEVRKFYMELKEEIASNPELLQEVEHAYNSRFRNYVAPNYADARYLIGDLIDEMQKNHPKGKIFRKNQVEWAIQGLYEGKGINAHDVGGGKTDAAILLAAAMKRRGMAQKPMLVVPAKIIHKWERAIKGYLPNAKIVNLGKLDAKTRTEKLFNLANTNADFVLISHEGFENIELPVADELRYLDELLLENIDDPDYKGRDKGKLEEKMASLRKIVEQRERDGRLTMDKLGVDMVVVDEGHNYKNIGIRNELVRFKLGTAFGVNTGSRDVKGPDGKPVVIGKDDDGKPVYKKEATASLVSARSYDLRFKARFITERNNGNNVFLLTATPTPNKPMEVFTMLKHLDTHIFDEYGIQTDKDFSNQFFDMGMVMNPTAGEAESVLRGIVNAQELRGILNRFVDKRDTEQLGITGVPEENVERHWLEQSDGYALVADDLRKREQAMPSPFERQPGDDTIIAVYTGGRAASVDPRLYGGGHAGVTVSARTYDAETDKIQAILDLVEKKHAERPEAKQLIFLDAAGHQQVERGQLPENLHAEIKKSLIDSGAFRPEQIAIINGKVVTDPKTGVESSSGDRDLKKQAIVDAYTDGKILVVIGTTTSMGEGMGLQKGTTDIYHADFPYTPGAIRQRNGRGVRYGNKEAVVNTHLFFMKGTFDGLSYGIIANKKGWNEAIWDKEVADYISTAEEMMGNAIPPREMILIEMETDPLKKAQLIAGFEANRVHQARAQAGEIVSALHGRRAVAQQNIAKFRQELAEREAKLRDLVPNEKVKDEEKRAEAFKTSKENLERLIDVSKRKIQENNQLLGNIAAQIQIQDAEYAAATRRLEAFSASFVDQLGNVRVKVEDVESVIKAYESGLTLGQSDPSAPVAREDIEKYLTARDVIDPAAPDRLEADLMAVREASTAPYQMDLFAGVPNDADMTPAQVDELADRLNAEIEEAFTDDFYKRGYQNPEVWGRVFAAHPVEASTIIPEMVKGVHPGEYVAARGIKINTPADFAAILMPLRNPLQESMKVAYLDASNRIIELQVVTVGIVDSVLVDPRVMLGNPPKGTKRMVIAHNHPSGNPQPSREDIKVTRQVIEAAKLVGIPILDHVITNGGTYQSLRGSGLVSFTEQEYGRMGGGKGQPPPKTLDEQAVADWELVPRKNLREVRDPGTLDGILKAMRQADPDSGHAILLTTKYTMTAVVRFPKSATVEQVQAIVARAAMRNGASAMLIDLASNLNGDAMKMARAMYQAGQMIDVELLDVATLDNQSLRESGLMTFQEERAEYGQRAGENDTDGYMTNREGDRRPSQQASPQGDELAKKAPAKTWMDAYLFGRMMRDAGLNENQAARAVLIDGKFSDQPYSVRIGEEVSPAEIAFYKAGINGRDIPEYVTGWRYGDLPESGRSRNFRDDIAERGVSLMALDGEEPSRLSRLYEVFNRNKRDAVKVGGWYIGRGSDGEPLIVGAEKIDFNDSRTADGADNVLREDRPGVDAEEAAYDAMHREAVERGDRVTAQRLVDERAALYAAMGGEVMGSAEWSERWNEKDARRTASLKEYKKQLISHLADRAKAEGWRWGYQAHPKQNSNFPWVVYFDTPVGQISFHVGASNEFLDELPAYAEANRRHQSVLSDYEKAKAAALAAVAGRENDGLKVNKGWRYGKVMAGEQPNAIKVDPRYLSHGEAKLASESLRLKKEVAESGASIKRNFPSDLDRYAVRPDLRYSGEWDQSMSQADGLGRLLGTTFSPEGVSTLGSVSKGRAAADSLSVASEEQVSENRNNLLRDGSNVKPPPVKSRDFATYDILPDGTKRLIPLSERFDRNHPSIFREDRPSYGSPKPSKTVQEMERELEALRQELKHLSQRIPKEAAKANEGMARLLASKQKLIDQLLAQRANVAESQRLLAAYMREQKIPDQEQKRMISAIIRLAKLKTPAGLERHYRAAIEHIDGKAKFYAARESINKVRELLKASFPKIVNMYPRGKLTADAHKELKKIAVITNFDEKRIDKELDRLGDEIDAFSDPDRTSEPARPLADVLHEQFLVMTFGNLNGQNPDQAKKAVESLEKFIELGMFEHQAKEKARQERIAKLRETAVDIISGGKGAMDKVDRLRKNLNRGVARRVVDAIDAYDTGHQSFEWLLDKLSRFEGQSGVLKSELQYWADLAHRATHDEVSGRRDAWGQVQTKLQEIYGLKGYRLAHVLSENSKVVAKTGVMLAGGKEAPMSRNQAYKLWQVFQDPSQYDRLLNPRNGYTADTPAQLEAFMGTKLTEYAKWQLDEFYPKYYEGVNRVYRELYFIDLPFNNRYSPITAEFENAFEDDKLLENPKRQSSVLNGSLKMRKPNANSEIRLVDGDSLLVRHIVQMEHFKHWGLVMRDMRGVFNNPDVSRAVRDYHGDFAARTLKGFVNDFARGGEDQALVLGSLDKMRSYFTRAVVASGVTTLKQLTSIPAAMSDLGPGEFMAGLASFMTNPVGKSREMFAASKMLQNRYEAGFDRDVMLALRRSEPTRLSGAASIGEIFSWFTRGGDIAAVLAAGYTMYRSTMNKAMAAGKSADVAKAEAVVAMEKAVERVQQAGNVKDLGAFQRLGSFAKLFTMFMTAPIAYYRVWSGGWRNLVHGRGSKAENVRRIALTHIVLPMFFQYVADAFMWGNPDDDDEDDRLIPWLPKTQTRALLLGPMNGLFIAGNGLNHIIAAFQKEKTFGDFASVILPPADIGNDITKAARRIGRSIINGEITEKDLRSLLEDIAEAGGKLTGMPTGPAMRMGTGIYEGTTDQTEFPIRRALGYSRFMLGEDPLNDDRGSGAAGTRNNLRPERPTLRGFAERPTLGRQ